MKKLLTLFATLAAVVVFTFGIAACEETKGDNSVTTLPEAETAYEEAMDNEKSYKIKSTVKIIGGRMLDGFTDLGEITMEVNYDFENKKLSNIINFKSTDGKQFEPIQSYLEVIDNKIYIYTHGLEGNKWIVDQADYNEETWSKGVKAYSEYPIEFNPVLMIESFDGYTFNESTKTFIKEENGINYRVAFRKGELFRISGEGTYFGTEIEFERVYSFGNTSVKIPKEAKDAPVN